VGWPDIAEDDDQLVGDIIARTRSLRANWITWAASINANGTTGDVAAARYQEITSYRAFMVAKVASNASGIAAAYLRRRPSLAPFTATQVNARWAEQLAVINSFVTFFRANWPAASADNAAWSIPAGLPAFTRYRASPDDQLEDLPITFTAPQKTAMLAQINAVLAAFTTS
jgi:hypothetical protein